MGLDDRTYLDKTYGVELGKASLTGYCIKFKSLQHVVHAVLESAIREVLHRPARDDARPSRFFAIQSPVTTDDPAFELRQLGPTNAAVLDRIADGVLDGPVVPTLLAEFLSDRRHHLIVALCEGLVVGMITAVDYVHIDKPAQLWINEVGVALYTFDLRKGTTAKGGK